MLCIILCLAIGISQIFTGLFNVNVGRIIFAVLCMYVPQSTSSSFPLPPHRIPFPPRLPFQLITPKILALHPPSQC